MPVDEIPNFGGHERKVLKSLEKHEIQYCSNGKSAKNAYLEFQSQLVFERKDKAGDIHYRRAEHKRDAYRYEYGGNHSERLSRIDVITEIRIGIAPSLYQSKGKRCAEQLKHH